MICPKCGFEQPENPECMRCGIVISRYKGPMLGGSPVPAVQTGGYPPLPPRPASTPPPPPPGYGAAPPPPPFGNETVRINTFPPPPPAPVMNVVGTVYGDPAPALAGGGTVYGGPMPAGGGTVYGGPSAPTSGASQPSVRAQNLTMGALLSESFSIYFSNFIPFLLISAVMLSPLFIYMAWVSSLSSNPQKQILYLLLAIPIQLACSFVAASGITYGVYQHLRGGSPSVTDCLKVGVTSFLPVIILAIVQTIGIMVGLILCIIPAILLSVQWAVSTPVMVEERPGTLEALRRSSYLTDGYRGAVFGVLFVLGLIQRLGSKLLELAINDLGTFLMASSAIDLLMTGLLATASAVMYYRLRSAKESIDVDQIASVFA